MLELRKRENVEEGRDVYMYMSHLVGNVMPLPDNRAGDFRLGASEVSPVPENLWVLYEYCSS